MGEVLVDVARIDDEEILFRLKAVEICVVDGAAVLVGDDAVLRLIEIQRLHVAGQDVLQNRTMSGPSTSIRPMWDTSKMAQWLRQ